MKIKGYTFNKNKKKWQAQIRLNGKKKTLGYFDNETDAHKAYLRAKILHIIINYGADQLKHVAHWHMPQHDF